MRNVLLKIQYDGSAFHGFQVQKEDVTVQQTLQDALVTLFGQPVTVTGCSRTDSGVHALWYVAKVTFNGNIAVEKIPYALATVLPKQLSVIDAAECDADFHPRYDVVSKTYIYRVYVGRFVNPFESGYSWHCKFPIDVDKMKSAAGCFVGKHDFKGFMASGSSVTDTVRTVSDCSVERFGDILQISITADGFLYNMVRIIAGTLVEIGGGKIDENDLPCIIASGVREKAGITAPAHGLFLAKVDYGKDVFSKNEKEDL